MRAVDTNLLARYYLADDPAQSRIANRLLEAGGLFIPKTVVLELAWVLESVAEQPAVKVRECLRHLVALPGVTVEDEEEVQGAIELSSRGLDFADALHLCASSACSEMLTFDARFVQRAARVKPTTRVALPGAAEKSDGVAQRKAVYKVRKKARARPG